MPIAAVPEYLRKHLGKHFAEASPALRFLMYLPIWTTADDQSRDMQQRGSRGSEEAHGTREAFRRGGPEAARGQLAQRGVRTDEVWGKSTSAAKEAWNKVTALSSADVALNRALAARANALAETLLDQSQSLLILDANAIAPFTTGLGNEHPLENGFAFLSPYGMPYLAGSGVKGVLRQAARELAGDEWGGDSGWRDVSTYRLKIEGKVVELSLSDVLFGRESADGERVRGVLTFWDVMPQIEGGKLMVEVMTPHQSHYYQSGQTPHDSGKVIPINFLTVPPGSRFVFHVLCDTARLQRIAPALSQDGRWETLLTAAFTHAFAWLGFGAKTAVGYGAMEHDRARGQRRAAEHAERAAAQRAAAERASMSPNAQRIADFAEYMRKRVEALRGALVYPNGAEHNHARELARAALESAEWTADERSQAADVIENWLPKVVRIDLKEERKKLKLRQLRGES